MFANMQRWRILFKRGVTKIEPRFLHSHSFPTAPVTAEVQIADSPLLSESSRPVVRPGRGLQDGKNRSLNPESSGHALVFFLKFFEPKLQLYPWSSMKRDCLSVPGVFDNSYSGRKYLGLLRTALERMASGGQRESARDILI